MRFVIAAAVAATALGAGAPVLAQTTSFGGVYGNLGWSENQVQGANTGSVTGRVGGRFGRYVGVEAEGSIGVNSGDRTFMPGAVNQTDVAVKQQLAGAVYGVGFLPLTPNFDLLARVGYGGSRYDIDPTGVAGYRVNENGIRYGAGAQYFFDGKNGLRVDYTRQEMNNPTDPGGYFNGKDHANVWAVAFAHKF